MDDDDWITVGSPKRHHAFNYTKTNYPIVRPARRYERRSRSTDQRFATSATNIPQPRRSSLALNHTGRRIEQRSTRANRQYVASTNSPPQSNNLSTTDIDWPGLKPGENGKRVTTMTNTPNRAFSYRNALLQVPVNNVEKKTRDTSAQGGKSTSKTPKMKSKTKQRIDQMLSDVGGAFLFICHKCFMGRPPRMKAKSSKGMFCDSPHRHPWDSSKVMVHRSPEKTYPLLIRTRPAEHFTLRAKICPFVFNCRFGTKCRCAHNRIEIKVWNLGPISHDDIVKRFAIDKPLTGFCCSYCNRIFQVKWELDNHTNTPEHRAKLTLDKERPWQHREPPDNIINGEYELCPSVNNSGCCMFSKASATENACPKAHSIEELEEWRERHQYRQMKLLRAKQQNLFSFMDEIQAEYASTDSEIDVISEQEPNGVQIAVDKNVTQFVKSPTTGSYQFKWTFSIHCSKEKNLTRVGLFYDGYRVHFHLSSPKNVQEPQVCPGTKICLPHQNGSQYHIDVLFKSRMIGMFKQWVIFDFDEKPVVKRELVVHAGLGVNDLPQDMNPRPPVTVWDGTNSKIIPYVKDNYDEMKTLETKYKLADFQVELDRNLGTLTRENYKTNMDRLLRMEEKARQEQLSTFCIVTDMEIHAMVTINSAAGSPYIIAQNGQLFGNIDIAQSSIDDSDASQIALTSVDYVLIKFAPKASKAYEAQIVMDDADGRTKDAIYVRLTKNCVQDLKLAANRKIEVQIQFRLNRFHFCMMRRALNQLMCTRILFPTKNEHPALIHRFSQSPDSRSKFNRLQEGAVRFLREKGGLNSKTPLLLLYGPFGTGKTYTIANGVMNALRDPDTHILICTHTNSAADLYITDYFDAFVQNWTCKQYEMDMLRVYPIDRDVRTIPVKVKKYMLFNRQGNIKKLEEWDVRGKRIVITTTFSATLLASFPQLRGYFTHILIDEAAQALETEAIIPLILAKSDTCIVLAGDHIQMGPKVYSKEAREAKFHQSVLERLFDHCLKNRCHRHILLTSNYRTHENILAFLSKVFYSAEDIEACGNQPRHPMYHPLEFRAVKGDDMMIGNSYVNTYEVLEAVNRVKEILDHWPEKEWGPKSPEQIGVFAPYRLQVQQLRREFRKRGLHRVYVDSLQGVQGKQFRVVIISTVRTQTTINKKDPDTEYYLGFLSDMRQLNTAFTRSQSLVVVVGNPIALCSIGECCNVWKKYIKECEREGSLYPQGIAYADIRLEISAATTTLDPNAVSFIPQGYTRSTQPHEIEAENVRHRIHDQNLEDKHDKAEPSDESDDETDFNTEDVILQALRRQLRNDRRRQNEEDESTSDEDADNEIHIVSPGNIRMVDEDDRVRLIEEADDPISRGTELETGTLVPSIFHMDLDGRCHATPKDVTDNATEIAIANMSQRATAMDGDEVTVQILENGENGQSMKPKDVNKVYGKVVNVDGRAVDYTDKKLVCLVDPYSENLMVPVNRRLPKILILYPNKSRKTSKGKRTYGHLVIPICRLTRHGVQRKRDVVVSNKDRPHKLFQVQWRSWKKGYSYPLGVVIAELPAGDNKTDGLMILKQIYEIQTQEDSLELVEKYPLGWSIPDEEYRKRKDLRDQLVFTIDPPGSEDLDDALSVKKVNDERYVVGVHIADVSYFVACGTSVDGKARQAATSFYPASDKPIHMLPPRLSTDLCSLRSGQDKLTMSVFLMFNQYGHHIPAESTISRSVVHSKIQLTYDDAENIISDADNDHPDSAFLRPYLNALSCLACACRKERLGNAAFSQPGSSDILSHPQAHILVEEMMILANETVARFLFSKLPQCTPLRRQLPPLIDRFRDWKNDHHECIEESSQLTHAKETSQSILRDNVQSSGENHMVQINVLRNTWQLINECVTNDRIDMFRLAGLVCTDQYYPQLAASQSALHRILFNGEYISSGDHSAGKHIHSSLAKTTYTHFTSPIRRYIDIVVHRLVVAILNRSKTLPHDGKDVTQICHNCNIRSFAAGQFELQTHALNTALGLKNHPMQVHGFIEVLTDKNVQLGFKHDDRVSESLKKARVGFSVLKPVVKPELEDEREAVMKWKERVYHVRGMPHLKANDIRANQSTRVKLQVDHSHLSIIKVPAHNWRCINAAIARQNWIEAKRQIHAVEASINSSNASRQTQRSESGATLVTVEDVTCETDDDTKKKKHYVQFEHTFKVGNVAQVQLYPVFNRGILSPNIQLYQMTPTLDFCVEHRSQPVQCLSTVADHVPKRKDIQTYKETWLPLIDMMAAYNAVQQNETVVVHGVRIDWQQHSHESLPEGSFILTKKFCKERHIEISDFNPSGLKQAYLCIRHTNRQTASIGAQGNDLEQRMTFVAHAWTLDVKATEEKDPEKVELNIFFEVNQMSAPFPRVLRRSGHQPEECTVEIISVCYPDSRLEAAMKGVNSSSSLVKNVCLLTPDKAEYDQDADDLDMQTLTSAASKRTSFEVNGCQLNRLNRPQTEAVRKALSQRFTVIQGPPGTGKTVTGAYLVYFFTEQNKLLPNRRDDMGPQILYCGPSNKAVDVITEYLKNFDISIVRVYGKEIELREFPIPGLPQIAGKTGARNVVMDSRHENISLHHLIRMKHRNDGLEVNSCCDTILEYDKRFRKPGYKPDDKEIKAYLKIIKKAEREELKQYQVVLSTCSAAGSHRIKEGTYIVQCIVDEAGMCNEPENLIPLVSTKPLQIVLIGDHKQLRPIIPEPTARLLGMDVSLLERYAKQINMLTIQYRMHEAICGFPSMAFYDNRLVTPQVIKKRPSMFLRGVWPGDASHPIAFCHCVGDEETLSVKTAEGNEMSKANMHEVQQVQHDVATGTTGLLQVNRISRDQPKCLWYMWQHRFAHKNVRMAKVLVDVYKINAKEIVVLSQYRLQCDKIATALKVCGKTDVDVRTVTQSQGSEWNYVIMSTVRSLPRVEIEERPNFGWRKKYLGFITDENQVNVALTRAKHGLVIVGNKYLLQTHKLWKDLLEHYEEVKCLVDAHVFLRGGPSGRNRMAHNRRQ